MMCYRDTTFCDGANRSCAKFDTCPRAITDRVIQDASRQMLSISQYADARELKCYEPKKDETK